MNSKLVRAFAVGAIAAGAATMANAQQSNPKPQGIDLGKYEFESHCAICHGSNGAGQVEEPSYWSLVNKNIPNLTMVSRGNGGVFPFTRVYETIDGRQHVQAHGSRDMPIWGKEFSAEGLTLNPYYDAESFARAKILALTEYVYRLQVK